MQMMNCKIGTVSLLEENILLVDIDSEKEIGVEHVSEFKSGAKRLMKAAAWYSIVSYGEYTLPTIEARKQCENGESVGNILGKAMVVHSLAQLILAKHIIKTRKTKFPTKIFTDLNKAKKWVNELRIKNNDNQSVVKV